MLELDEMWSFVCRRKNKRWVWLAQCRRTRQIVAYAIGDRSEATCRVLWGRIPKRYKKCLCYTDFWAAYARYCQQSSITLRVRVQGKPATLSASTTRYANG